jgi:nitroimidazol reductase NimA-like FMN-containing flavoprotein (pyridoxamine 5'-phosphate oxidase superfamily)
MPRNYSDQTPTAFQRLPEYKRDDEWIRAFLRTARMGHIASVQDGQPFLNPSTFWFDEDNHQIIFHSNLAGRIRSNIEANPKVCFEASELGKMLPANVALEFSLQFRSVVIFGTARLITNPDEARRVLYGLIHKYFPEMRAGKEFREMTRNWRAHPSTRSGSKNGAARKTGKIAPTNRMSGHRLTNIGLSKKLQSDSNVE